MSPEGTQSLATLLERSGPRHARLCGAEEMVEGQWRGIDSSVRIGWGRIELVLHISEES